MFSPFHLKQNASQLRYQEAQLRSILVSIQPGQDYAPCPSHLAFSERRKNNVCHHTDLGLYCMRTATTLFMPRQHAAHSRLIAFV